MRGQSLRDDRRRNDRQANDYDHQMGAVVDLQARMHIMPIHQGNPDIIPIHHARQGPRDAGQLRHDKDRGRNEANAEAKGRSPSKTPLPTNPLSSIPAKKATNHPDDDTVARKRPPIADRKGHRPQRRDREPGHPHLEKPTLAQTARPKQDAAASPLKKATAPTDKNVGVKQQPASNREQKRQNANKKHDLNFRDSGRRRQPSISQHHPGPREQGHYRQPKVHGQRRLFPLGLLQRLSQSRNDDSAGHWSMQAHASDSHHNERQIREDARVIEGGPPSRDRHRHCLHEPSGGFCRRCQTCSRRRLIERWFRYG